MRTNGNTKHSLLVGDTQPIPGDEAYVNGEAIDETWRNAWSRCIARIWYEEYQTNKDPKTNPETDWHKKLFSKDQDLVMDALIEAGFIRDAILDGPPEQTSRDMVNSEIIVKQEFEEILVGQPGVTPYKTVRNANEQTEEWKRPDLYDEKDYINGWYQKPGLKYTLILTVPNAPKEPEDFVLALADFQSAENLYPFTPCC